MLQKVRSIISRELSIRPERISPDKTLRHDLNMDRADLLSVITGLEDACCITIDYNRLDSFETVADLDSYVSAVLGS